MASKKRKAALGTGLDELLGPDLSWSETPASTPVGAPMMLSLADMAPGQYQPRTRMDEGALYELAESIKAQGIMQPILVRRLAQPRLVPAQTGQGAEVDHPAHYEIIAGERRYRAARLAGLDEVPVLVRDVPDEAAAAMALIENIQREDLNPLEEAQGVQRLIGDFGLTHEQVARAIGKSRSATSNLLRLLQLTTPVQTMLMAGDIDMGHARALLALQGAAQITAANQVVARKMTVRDAEALVRKLAVDTRAATPGQRNTSRSQANAAGTQADIARVEQELSDLLAAQVQVRVKKHLRSGGQRQPAGEVAIGFASLDELNGLIDRLRGTASD